MSEGYEAAVVAITRVAGVRSVCIVDAVDGIVVAEASMMETDPAPVAALAASLTQRLEGPLRVAGQGAPRVVHLECEGGHLVVMPVSSELLLASVSAPDVNLGLLRLALADAAERLA